MSSDAEKRAGLRDFAVNRLRDVSQQLAASGGPLRRQVGLDIVADNLENPVLGRAMGSAIGGAADVVGTAIQPGDSALGRWLTDKAVTPLGAIVGISALAYPLGAIRSFEENRVLGPLSEGQLRGETPMTDPFHSFVQQRKYGHALPHPPKPGEGTKTANLGRSLGGLIGGAIDPLTTALKKLVMRSDLGENIAPQAASAVGRSLSDLADNPQDLMRAAQNFAGPNVNLRLTGHGVVQPMIEEFSPGRALLSGAGAIGLGGLLGLGDPATDTAAYQVQKMLFPAHERVKAEDEAVKSFASQAGKNTADALNDLLMGAMGGAVGAAKGMNTSFSQDAVFMKSLESDPLLRDASPQDRQMLQQAFSSMARFAPDVATDEFAVRNFLRESMLAANGPDYATLGNLARVNRALTGDPR